MCALPFVVLCNVSSVVERAPVRTIGVQVFMCLCRNLVGRQLRKAFPGNSLQLMVQSGAKGSSVSVFLYVDARLLPPIITWLFFASHCAPEVFYRSVQLSTFMGHFLLFSLVESEYLCIANGC